MHFWIKIFNADNITRRMNKNNRFYEINNKKDI